MAAVSAAYFLLQQGLIADARLDALKLEHGIDATGLDDFLDQNTRARFYDNKLKLLDFFLVVLMPQYLALAQPILSKDYTALDIRL